MKEFRLPDPGEGLVEAEIVTWRVAVGDEVAVNDIVVEIETSKSLVELPSPYAGTVAALLVAEGEMAEVGAPIISIDDGVPALAAAPAPAPAAPTEDGEIEAGKIGGSAPGGRLAVLVGYGPRTTEAKRRPRKAPKADVDEKSHQEFADTFSTDTPVSFRADQRSPLSPADDQRVGEPLPGPGAAPAEPRPSRTAVLAKPPVRKLARDLGVDLAMLDGTGPDGVITRSDVQAAAAPAVAGASPGSVASGSASHSPDDAPTESVTDSAESVTASDESVTASAEAVGLSTAADPAPNALRSPMTVGDTRIPIKGVRKATAEAMVASAFTAPHVTEWLTCDVTGTMELLERLKARRDFAGVRVTPLLLVAKAVCLALSRTPDMNAYWDAPAGEIVLKGTVNLGFAASTPRGLLVPNIKDAQTFSLLELAGALNELVAVAKEGRTQPSDTAQGTFTITNVGIFGVDAGTPILNPGESGILALGNIARRPWVVGAGADERIEPRWVTTLAVSFDHRVVDGEQGSKFLAQVAGIMCDPGLALLF